MSARRPMIPSAITAITEATPMTMLRMVRAVRTLLWRTVSNASRIPSVSRISGRPATRPAPAAAATRRA